MKKNRRKMIDPNERVTIWNTFFKLAWTETQNVFEVSSGCKSRDTFAPEGGCLPAAQYHGLAMVVLCNLAIEARANHLIEEMVESGKIDPEVGRAAMWLPTKHKWFLLPTLAGVKTELSWSRGPHQAIVQLCDLRNDVVHVNYAGLQRALPKPMTLVSYFKRFVQAMEDMNVLLNRDRPHGALPEVLKIGTFHCE